MKLKNRDWTERERSPGAVDAHLVEEDRVVRTVLLALGLFGVAVLALVAVYLLDLKWTPQDINKRPLQLHHFRFWKDGSSSQNDRNSTGSRGEAPTHM
jgi:hypothetical protein